MFPIRIELTVSTPDQLAAVTALVTGGVVAAAPAAAAPAAAKGGAKAVAKQPAAPAAATETKPAESTGATVDDCRKIIVEVGKKNMSAAKALLAEYDAKTGKDVKPEDAAKFVAKAKELLK